MHVKFHGQVRELASSFLIATMLSLLFFCPLGLSLHLPTSAHVVRPTNLCRAAVTRMAASDYDEAFEAARAMKVSEIKAELDMRGISYAGLFEKAELATLLATSRSQGRADPSIIDDFNKQNLERMVSDEPATPTPSADDLSGVTAGDGGLPGGMTPEKMQKLMSNPEMMALLSNPRLQEVMKAVMEKGAGGVDATAFDDPEMREVSRPPHARTSSPVVLPLHPISLALAAHGEVEAANGAVSVQCRTLRQKSALRRRHEGTYA